jgi:hypothetical protein
MPSIHTGTSGNSPWRRVEGIDQLAHRHLVEQGQLALVLEPILHDSLRVELQDAGQGGGHRCRQDGAVGVALDDQRQRPRVVGVGVGEQTHIHAAGLVDAAEIGQLVAREADTGLRRHADARVHQHSPAGRLHQQATRANLVGAPQEGHAHSVSTSPCRCVSGQVRPSGSTASSREAPAAPPRTVGMSIAVLACG